MEAAAMSSALCVPLVPSPTGNRGPSNLMGGVERLWHRRHFAMMAGIGLLLGLLRTEAAIDTDSLWSTRFGLDFLNTGVLPRTDSYSWTAAGRSWIPNSWGWNVLLGLGYRIDGIPGIWILGTTLAAALGLLIAHLSARIGAAPLPTAMVFAVLGMLALVVSPRAQTVSNVIALAIPLFLPIVLFSDNRRAVRGCAAVVALQMLWMNLHTAAILGPAILCVAGAGLLLANGHRGAALRREAARLAGVVILAATACLATPYGLAPILHVDAVRRASVGIITEWDHPGFGSGAQIIALLMIAAAVVTIRIAWRARRFDAVCLLALFAILTASAIRFAPMIAVFALPELAVAMGRLKVRPFMQGRIVAAECLVLGAFAAVHLGSVGHLSTSAASPTLVAALPHDCTLVNDYEVGGAVILLRPDVHVSIDGRNDMYGRRSVFSAIDMLKDTLGTTARIDAAGVNCVLAISGYRLVHALSHDSNWHVVGRDGTRTLLVRRDYQQ
jgi:hypothetical protein